MKKHYQLLRRIKINSITIAGSVGKDAELRYMPDGTAVTSISIADNQGKDKNPIWWRAQLFGKRAESLSQYLTKGQAVTVSGTVTEREYTDKNGQQVKSMEIRVQDVALQGGRKEAGIPPHPASAKAAKAPQQAPRAPSGFDEMDDSDIPFRDPLSYRGAHLVL